MRDKPGDRWALVTGAGRRLARVVALELAAHGWGVAVHYLGSAADAEATAEAVRALNAPAVTLRADLADNAALAELMRNAISASGGKLRALVNSAALFEHDLIETLEPEAFHTQMQVNALAPSLLARAFAASLKGDARGAIVNFLDFKLATPYPDHYSYTLSKYALAGATEMLARALAPRVRVNAVAPGCVLAAPGQSDADYQKKHADTPLHYGVTAEDIAASVRFLLESRAITGQTLFVDAGLRFRSFERDIGFE